MPRTRPVADSTALHRRSLLAAAGAAALSAGTGYALWPGGGRAAAAGTADAADEAVAASSRR
ncbi:TIGR03767 family metallophosphoesterase, partial [Streptomyces sp. Sce081]